MRSKHVDVVILIECIVSVAEVLKALNTATGQVFHYSDSPAQMKTIQVFTRFSRRFVRPAEESNRYSVRHLAPQRRQICFSPSFPSRASFIGRKTAKFKNVLYWRR